MPAADDATGGWHFPTALWNTGECGSCPSPVVEVGGAWASLDLVPHLLPCDEGAVLHPGVVLALDHLVDQALILRL